MAHRRFCDERWPYSTEHESVYNRLVISRGGPEDVHAPDPLSYPMAPTPSGLWVPERLVPSEAASGEHLARYATLTLTLITGLAYLLGVWSVARFSKGVGATAT